MLKLLVLDVHRVLNFVPLKSVKSLYNLPSVSALSLSRTTLTPNNILVSKSNSIYRLCKHMLSTTIRTHEFCEYLNEIEHFCELVSDCV